MTPTLMMWMVLFPVVIAPACAVVAGGITWTITRQERPEDGTLLRHFLVVLAMLMLASYGVVTTDTVKEWIDPTIRMRRELVQSPVLSAVRENFASEWDATQREIDRGLAAGMRVDQVRSTLRLQQVVRARRLLAFSAPPAPIAYARGILPALEALEQADPARCLELAYAQSVAGRSDPLLGLAPDLVAGYEAGLVVLLSNNSLSGSGKRKSEDGWNTFSQEEQRASWLRVTEPLVSRYGAGAARPTMGGLRALDPRQACGATIEFLRRALQEPPILADLLVIRLLRS